jgi:hypothetical protein
VAHQEADGRGGRVPNGARWATHGVAPTSLTANPAAGDDDGTLSPSFDYCGAGVVAAAGAAASRFSR